MFRLFAVLSLVSIFNTAQAAAPARTTAARTPANAFAGPVTSELHEIILDASELKLTLNRGTSFLVGTTYLYTILPSIQLGGSVGLAATSGATVFAFLVGPTLNFPMDGKLTDAFFADARIGFYTASVSSVSDSGFAFALSAGKRFEIFKHLIYRPNITVGKAGSGDALISLEFFSVSALF